MATCVYMPMLKHNNNTAYIDIKYAQNVFRTFYARRSLIGESLITHDVQREIYETLM